MASPSALLLGGTGGHAERRVSGAICKDRGQDGHDADPADPVPAGLREANWNGVGDKHESQHNTRDPIGRSNIAHDAASFRKLRVTSARIDIGPPRRDIDVGQIRRRLPRSCSPPSASSLWFILY